jgi:hypothetical protein
MFRCYQALLPDMPRLWWLQACWASQTRTLRLCRKPKAAPRAATTVAVVLADAQRRLARFGGRAGMPRSVASVLCASITRLLGGGVIGVVRATQTVRNASGMTAAGVVASPDGKALFLFNTIHEHVRTADDEAVLLRVWCEPCHGVLRRKAQPLWPMLALTGADVMAMISILDVACAPDGCAYALVRCKSRLCAVVAMDEHFCLETVFPVREYPFRHAVYDEFRPHTLAVTHHAIVLVSENEQMCLLKRTTGVVVEARLSGGPSDANIRLFKMCVLSDGCHVVADTVHETGARRGGDEFQRFLGVYSLSSAHKFRMTRTLGRGIFRYSDAATTNSSVARSACDELVATDFDRVLVFNAQGA